MQAVSEMMQEPERKSIESESKGSDHFDPDQTQDLPNPGEPLVAKLVDQQFEGDAELEPGIRVGSPFKFEPSPISGGQLSRMRSPADMFYDVGPLKYTAMGAVGAAMMVLCFAVVAVWWYPVGGTLITGLGCVLSIFGMYSNRRFVAVGCLGLHLVLFIVCYGRAVDM